MDMNSEEMIDQAVEKHNKKNQPVQEANSAFKKDKKSGILMTAGAAALVYAFIRHVIEQQWNVDVIAPAVVGIGLFILGVHSASEINKIVSQKKDEFIKS